MLPCSPHDGHGEGEANDPPSPRLSSSPRPTLLRREEPANRLTKNQNITIIKPIGKEFLKEMPNKLFGLIRVVAVLSGPGLPSVIGEAH